MSNIQYLEIDSSYRDRNSWPDPAEFEVPIWQSSVKDKYTAVDPISKAASKLTWVSGRFIQCDIGTNITVTVLSTTIANGASGDQFVVNVSAPGGNLQPVDGYYVGAVGIHTKSSVDENRRIIGYSYLGNDRGKFTFLTPFPSILQQGDTIVINDPTNLDDKIFPIFFVPNGGNTTTYLNCILYNMTTFQYRKIVSYDSITRILTIDTLQNRDSPVNAGPIDSWELTDQYSIRESPPLHTTLATFNISPEPTIGWYSTTNDLNKFSFILPSTTPLTDDYTGDFLEVLSQFAPFYDIFGNKTNPAVWNGYEPTTAILFLQYDLQNYNCLIKGFYEGYTIRMISGNSSGLINTIGPFSANIVKFIPGMYRHTALDQNDIFILYKPNETRKIVKYVRYKGVSRGGTLNTVIFDDNASNINGYYTNLRVRFISGLNTGVDVLINQYIVEKVNGKNVKIAVFNVPDFADGTIYPVPPSFVFHPVSEGDEYEFASGFVNPPFSTELSIQPVLILPFYKDNLNPFINISNAIISQKETIRYEIELLNIIIPNELLLIGDCSRLVNYSYLYLELSNSALSNQGNYYIYSNNPNSSKAVFRLPIDDVAQTANSSFLKLDGDGMVQTITFRYKDNLKMSLKLQTGEILRTVQLEHFSPLAPNRLAQISASFVLKRII